MEAAVRTYLHVLVTFTGRKASAEFATLPRLCPCCGEMSPLWRLDARSTSPDDSRVDFAFQCSRPECRRVFIASYERNPKGEFTLALDDAEQWCDQLLTLHSSVPRGSGDSWRAP
jgi:hypothetical protein